MIQLFKNREKERDYLDDIYSSIHEDQPKQEKSFLKQREEEISKSDPDLDVLDKLIHGNYYTKDSYKKEEKKKKKKDKKKQKKSDKKSKKKNKHLLDLGDIYDGLDEVGEYREKIKSDDERIYQQRANGTLILLRETMKQVNEQITTSKTYLEELKHSRMRGALTAITAQTANMSSLLGTKLNVIKHISDVNNKLSDLEIKRAKELAVAKGTGANGEVVNEDYLMNNILKKVMNSDEFDIDKDENFGKKKKKSKKEKNKDKDDDDIYKQLIQGDEEGALENSKKKDIDNDFYDDDEDEDDEFDDDDVDSLLEERISELEDGGDLEFTSTEKAFKYEGRVRLAIEKDHKNDRWRFIALDDDDEEIVDYPLPTKKAVGRVSFDKEKGIAEDRLGNVYEIFYKNKNTVFD